MAIDEGANVNLRSPTGATPLHATALRGEVLLVRLLLDRGAHVDTVDAEGYTPLMVAALNGQADCLNELLAG